MHTQTYSCGSSKYPRTCTRTYWSWDVVGSEDRYADKTTYRGRDYNSSIFDFSNLSKRLDGYYREDANDRYYYNVVPRQFNAGFIVDTSNGTLSSAFNGRVKLENKSIDRMRKDSRSYEAVNNFMLTLVIILILICMTVLGYKWVMADGKFSLIG